MASVEMIPLPSGWYVENANADSPIYLVHWVSGEPADRREIDPKSAMLVAAALNDAVLRGNFVMRSGS